MTHDPRPLLANAAIAEPLLLRLRLLPPPLPLFFPVRDEEPSEFEIAAAHDLLIPSCADPLTACRS